MNGQQVKGLRLYAMGVMDFYVPYQKTTAALRNEAAKDSSMNKE